MFMLRGHLSSLGCHRRLSWDRSDDGSSSSRQKHQQQQQEEAAYFTLGRLQRSTTAMGSRELLAQIEGDQGSTAASEDSFHLAAEFDAAKLNSLLALEGWEEIGDAAASDYQPPTQRLQRSRTALESQELLTDMAWPEHDKQGITFGADCRADGRELQFTTVSPSFKKVHGDRKAAARSRASLPARILWWSSFCA